MGTKYRPSIKDQKATQRFHKNVRLKVANGAVKASFYLTQRSPEAAKGNTTASKKSAS
jgi:hypothetical protein